MCKVIQALNDCSCLDDDDDDDDDDDEQITKSLIQLINILKHCLTTGHIILSLKLYAAYKRLSATVGNDADFPLKRNALHCVHGTG